MLPACHLGIWRRHPKIWWARRYTERRCHLESLRRKGANTEEHSDTKSLDVWQRFSLVEEDPYIGHMWGQVIRITGILMTLANSGLTRWRLAVEMDAVAESERKEMDLRVSIRFKPGCGELTLLGLHVCLLIISLIIFVFFCFV